ncbi:MAG: hypothetical protein A3D94_08050 [Alphaproteobacteria bacterium RIFCSPHIGHO2_12_FULL_66_14]|jgi:hypothetical protein|nr:MAG: hypothetical protein A3D94_08050 [Alphaproteobacteria bacterium RIFCSPHIGHO2_12_FULL_66_14]
MADIGNSLDMKRPAEALLNRARAGQMGRWAAETHSRQDSQFPSRILSNLQISKCISGGTKTQGRRIAFDGPDRTVIDGPFNELMI